MSLEKPTLFTSLYFEQVSKVVSSIQHSAVEEIVHTLCQLRKRYGRLFILGVGGSAANASHAVADFRRSCQILASCPTDNVAELTASINDTSVKQSYSSWLRLSRLAKEDILLVLSVGGGDTARNVSTNIIDAIDYSKHVGAISIAIVGRIDGYASNNCDFVMNVAPPNREFLTPIVESAQSILLHAITFHPSLRKQEGTWESIEMKESMRGI